MTVDPFNYPLKEYSEEKHEMTEAETIKLIDARTARVLKMLAEEYALRNASGDCQAHANVAVQLYKRSNREIAEGIVKKYRGASAAPLNLAKLIEKALDEAKK